MSSEKKRWILEKIKKLEEFFSKKPEYIEWISQYGNNSVLFVSSVAAAMGLAGINLAFLSTHIANIIEGVIANFITEKKISSKDKINEKQFEELIEKIKSLIEGNTELTKEILSHFDNDEFKNALSEIKELRPLIEDVYAEIDKQLNEIEEQLVELSRVNITEIEIKLLKDRISEPQFFRPEGPLWIDFEKGYVYKRREVEEIKNRLKMKISF